MTFLSPQLDAANRLCCDHIHFHVLHMEIFKTYAVLPKSDPKMCPKCRSTLSKGQYVNTQYIQYVNISIANLLTWVN